MAHGYATLPKASLCKTAAIRRRFQLKVELKALRQEQRSELFREFCKQLRLVDDRGFKPERWVRGMNSLAYGHIANAAKVAMNMKGLTLEGFVGLLQQEIEATNGPLNRPIGFVH